MKLVRRRHQAWELYNLADDPTEMNDLSDTQAKTAERLQEQYQHWMQQNGVRPWPVKLKP